MPIKITFEYKFNNVSVEKVKFIKRVQREYNELFNEKLIIDFNKTFHIYPRWVLFNEQDCLDALNNICTKYNTSLEKFKSYKRLNTDLRPVMIEYMQFCIDKKYNLAKCAKLINKDRTTITYYKRKII